MNSTTKQTNYHTVTKLLHIFFLTSTISTILNLHSQLTTFLWNFLFVAVLEQYAMHTYSHSGNHKTDFNNGQQSLSIYAGMQPGSILIIIKKSQILHTAFSPQLSNHSESKYLWMIFPLLTFYTKETLHIPTNVTYANKQVMHYTGSYVQPVNLY